jgi:translation initiation factor 1 (eIF-1/SUI1)
MFGKKFACGSTVTKEDDIEVQGDFKEEIVDFIVEKFNVCG